MLVPDKIRYENGVKINEKIIPDNAVATKYVASWCQKGKPMKPKFKMDPIGITMHNTNDLKNVNDDAEQYTRATYPNCNMGGVVVHYYVDDLGAWQNLRENESGWHAADGHGNGNRRTIAIECIMSGRTGTENLKARDNAARLAASILSRYGWTIKDIYTHNHWMGQPDRIVSGVKKNCPYHLLPDWTGFLNLVQSYVDKLKDSSGDTPNVEEETTPIETPKKSFQYKDILVGDLLNFKGSKVYSYSTSKIPVSTVYKGRVKVTKKGSQVAEHPIHVRSIDESGKFIKGVYGWVDVADLTLESSAYLVKIVPTSLNVRLGPGKHYKVVQVIRDQGVYTITEEKDGWGRLQSGVGWISLDYTKKI